MPSTVTPATSATPIAQELTRTSPVVSRRASFCAIWRSRALFSLSELLTLIPGPGLLDWNHTPDLWESPAPPLHAPARNASFE